MVATARSRARSFTTLPLERGATPETSTPTAHFTRRLCYPTARSWSRAASAAPHLQLVAATSVARNSMIRQRGRGVIPATSARRTALTRRRCCPTARFWLLVALLVLVTT